MATVYLLFPMLIDKYNEKIFFGFFLILISSQSRLYNDSFINMFHFFSVKSSFIHFFPRFSPLFKCDLTRIRSFCLRLFYFFSFYLCQKAYYLMLSKSELLSLIYYYYLYFLSHLENKDKKVNFVKCLSLHFNGQVMECLNILFFYNFLIENCNEFSIFIYMLHVYFRVILRTKETLEKWLNVRLFFSSSSYSFSNSVSA